MTSESPLVSAAEYLQQGVELLRAKLSPHGFQFAITGAAYGSGGPFATGVFSKGDKAIELSVRHAKLGIVTYRAGPAEWSHSDYMWALGLKGGAQFPGFASEDPLDGFRRLVSDLDHCSDFIEGDGTAAVKLVKSAPSRPKGFKGLKP